jgi:hypothetical protein
MGICLRHRQAGFFKKALIDKPTRGFWASVMRDILRNIATDMKTHMNGSVKIQSTEKRA